MVNSEMGEAIGTGRKRAGPDLTIIIQGSILEVMKGPNLVLPLELNRGVDIKDTNF